MSTANWAAPDAPAEPVPAAAASAVAIEGGSAGVAVARGDAAWPTAAGHELGDDNPLADLEPVGVGGVLDGGFDLLRVGFGPLVAVSAALLLPLQVLDLVLNLRAGLGTEPTSIGDDMGSSLSVAWDGSAIGSAWMLGLARAVVLSFLGMVVGVMIESLLAGRMPSGGSMLRAAGRRWWVALVVVVLCVPVKTLAGCLAYVGFFVADALLMCTSVAAGSERLGPLAAFGRSWRLGMNNFGTALGVSFGGFVITTVLRVALYLGPVLLVQFFAPSEALVLITGEVAALALLVTQPLTACIAGRAYLEFRCRSEGLDLRRRRLRLGLASAAGEPAL